MVSPQLGRPPSYEDLMCTLFLIKCEIITGVKFTRNEFPLSSKINGQITADQLLVTAGRIPKQIY